MQPRPMSETDGPLSKNSHGRIVAFVEAHRHQAGHARLSHPYNAAAPMPLSPGSRLGLAEAQQRPRPDRENNRPVSGRGQTGRRRHGRGLPGPDAKLNATSRIKILPDVFAGDPDRLARFGREAQVLASLNHPNSRASTASRQRGSASARARARGRADPGRSPRAGPSRSPKRCRSRGRSPMRSRPRTRPASSIATSSRPTLRSGPTAS